MTSSQLICFNIFFFIIIYTRVAGKGPLKYSLMERLDLDIFKRVEKFLSCNKYYKLLRNIFFNLINVYWYDLIIYCVCTSRLMGKNKLWFL